MDLLQSSLLCLGDKPTALFSYLILIYLNLSILSLIVLIFPQLALIKLSPPLYCCLHFNKGTEINEFEEPHFCLTDVAAVSRTNVVVFYFIK